MAKVQELYNYLKGYGALSESVTVEQFSKEMQSKDRRENLHGYMQQNGFLTKEADFVSFDNALGSRDMTFSENVQHIGRNIGNTLQAAGKSFAEGADRTAEGLFGAIGTVIPGEDSFQSLAEASKAERAAQATLPSGGRSYRPVNTFESAGRKIASGDILGGIGEGIGATIETGAGSLPGMVVTATPVVGVPVFGVSQMQQFAAERAANSGKAAPDASDYAVAAPAAAVSAALERIGIGGLNAAPMRKYVTDTLTRRLGVNTVNTLAKAAIEGGTEAQQQIVQYSAEILGTQKDFDIGEAGRQALIAAAGGAGVGGMIGGPMSMMQKPESVRTDAGGREIATAVGQQVDQSVQSGSMRDQLLETAIAGQTQPQVRQAPVRESMTEKLAKRGVVLSSGARGFDQTIVQQESSGNPNAVNKLSGATGLYQIMPVFLKEGNRLLGTNYSMQDMKTPAKAEQIKNAVHGLWIRQFQRRNGRLPSAEEMAMMHHGGPLGYLRPNAKDAHGVSNAEYAQQVVAKMGQPGGMPSAGALPEAPELPGMDMVGDQLPGMGYQQDSQVSVNLPETSENSSVSVSKPAVNLPEMPQETQQQESSVQIGQAPAEVPQEMPQESQQQAHGATSTVEPAVQSPAATKRLEAEFVEQKSADQTEATPSVEESFAAQNDQVPEAGKTIEAKAEAKRRKLQKVEVRELDIEGRPKDGGTVNPGDVFDTATGRTTTPYPKGKHQKYSTQWLIENAIAEAESRGDDFNRKSFGGERVMKSGDIPPASRDSMLMYLFGSKEDQPKVVPSISNPLVEPKAEATKENPVTPPESKIKSWSDEWGRLKAEGDREKMSAFHSKVRTALNGPAQKAGDDVVRQFKDLDAEIREHAKSLKSEPATVAEKIKKQLSDAEQFTDEQRRDAGVFVQAFYDEKARQLGITADELYRKYPYQIEAGDAADAGLRQVAKLPATIDVDGVQRPTANSEGRPIHQTEEGVRNFLKWFGDSKVVDKDGKPLVVYHGTPNASFTEFNDGAHFTADPDYAAVYTNTSASSINSSAKRADAPAVMPVYLAIKNPFDTRVPAIRRVFEREFFNKYGNGTPLSDRGLPDWTDVRDLLEWIDETSQPFDGVLVDEGGTPDGGHRGLSWVPVKNTQIKSATGNTGKFDPENPSILRQISGKWYYSALQRAFEGAKQTAMPGNQWAQWLAGNSGKLGVKADEIRWSGVGDWLMMRGKEKVTKAEVLAFIEQNGVQVQEVMKGGFDSKFYNPLTEEEQARFQELINIPGGEWDDQNGGYVNARNRTEQEEQEYQALLSRHNSAVQDAAGRRAQNTKYQSYVLPGGDNYRELLLTLPGKRLDSYESVKRYYNIFVRRGGEPEWSELSDRRRSDIISEMPKEASIPDRKFQSTHWDDPNVLAHIRFNERHDTDGKKVLFIEEIQSDWGQKGKKDGFEKTPEAPFVTDTKAWVSLALKRMIRYASENGYDKVAFVNGEQSAERYDLSKQVDAVQIQPASNLDKVHVFVKPNGSKSFERVGEASAVDKSKLEEVLGKELAKKVIADTERSPEDIHEYSGLDLKVGGEGMKAFYDKIVPSVASDIVKKYGSNIEKQNFIGNHRVLKRGNESQVWSDGHLISHGETDQEALSKALANQNGFTITPKMREAAMSGLPLFQSGGVRGGFSPDRLTAILNQKSDFSTFVHETGHAYLDMLGKMASAENAHRQIKFDMDVLLKWFGVKSIGDWNKMTLDEQRKHHEAFAYNFELYVSEGKAPNAGLRGVFERFREWMKAVYQNIKGELNAAYRKEIGEDLPILTGEVRGVMDRMMANKPVKFERRPSPGARPIEAQDKTQAQNEADDISAMASLNPMPGWVPPLSVAGFPVRPADGKVKIGDRTVDLPEEDKPVRIEQIRLMAEQLIGRGLYFGKIKLKNTAGFHRRKTGEVRMANYNDVETLAHEISHFLGDSNKGNNPLHKLYTDKRFSDELEALSYTSADGKALREGFAEYMRLWFTQYDMAKQAAPKFTEAFDKFLADDKRTLKAMTWMQDAMHKWVNQGDAARFEAFTSGNQFTPMQKLAMWVAQRPVSLMRQQYIDHLHAAKLMGADVYGKSLRAEDDPYKQLQLINGVEGIVQESFIHGAPYFDDDGSIKFEGPSLELVFKKSLQQGMKILRAQEKYFVARRAAELKMQGRENLLSVGMIKEGLALAEKYPWFKKSFSDYQKYRENLLAFMVDCGYVEERAAKKFMEVNRNYVPFNREVEGIGQSFAGSGNFKRLKGGTQNLKHVYDNILLGDAQHIKAALRARAMRQLYSAALKSDEGGKWIAPLGKDARLVKTNIEQQAKVIADAMAALGMTVADGGRIISGDPAAETITDVEDIQQVLLDDPELMQFWTFGHKPSTTETGVDSFIDPNTGVRQWVEIQRDNKLLLDMVNGMAGTRLPDGLLGVAYRLAAAVKQFQTMTITAAWQFAGPNIVRDVQQAFILSGGKFRPVIDNVYGLAAMLHDLVKRDGWYHEMKAQGGGWSGRVRSIMTDTWEMERGAMAPKTRSKYHPVRVAQELLDVLMSIGDSAEMSTRVGFYIRMRKAGAGAREAAWQAREISTDFRKHGSYVPWVMLQRVTPFLGAFIQGADRDIRALAEMDGSMSVKNVFRVNRAKARIYAAGGAMITVAILIALMNDDDDRYEDLTPDQKTRFFHFFVGDQHFTVPKPHGFFSLMAAAGEAIVDTMKGQRRDDAGKFMAFALAYQLGADLMPGFVNPLYELAINKSFTGAPIIGERLQGLSPEFQFTDRTPGLYIAIGQKLGVAPDAVHHLVRGYTGYVSDFLNEATERALWNREQWGARPFEKDAGDFINKQFVQKRVPYRTKWTEKYYDLRRRAAEKEAVLSMLQKASAIRNRTMLDRFAGDENSMKLAAASKAFRQIDKAFSDQEMMIASIKYDPYLSAKEKEQRIDAYYEQKNVLLKEAYRQIEESLR